MNRRSFVLGASALAALAASARNAAIAQSQQSGPIPFDHDWLVREAERLASEPYQSPEPELPEDYADLTYSQYRAIWFDPDAAIWMHEPTRFRLDLFHSGFVYRDPVQISLVEDGQATQIPFSPSLFEYGHLAKPPEHPDQMAFSGFRARTPINTPDAWQEFVVFQGASYFRAVGRNQFYGLSARGLAINTAEPEGEEFPLFRHFWIEKPPPDSSMLVVHALLDSPSTAGAYRFEIIPGAETVMEVEAAIFPREEIEKVGIAPLTSMFMFNGMNSAGFDDYRRAVHDSNGLLMLSGAGEWIWRPLANPGQLQISDFRDKAPRGFGLMQRARRYEDYLDQEAKYERRPSLWIEPNGDWGEGFVELVEIPTDKETNDNIVAYWRPSGPVPAGGPWRFDYRMRWTDGVRPPRELLSVQSSRSGLSFDHERRLFVVDFATSEDAPELPEAKSLNVEVSASKGEVVNAVVHDRQADGTLRVSFELDPGDAELSELRMRLSAGDKPASETWLYRWTAT
jgi:glucans biosynthesis protein